MLTSTSNNISKFLHLFLFIIITVSFLFISCSKEPDNPIIDEDNSVEVYFKEPDSEKIITITTSTGGAAKVVGNNVLISVDSGAVDRDQLKSIIEETGGELVGQFKNIGLYQAEYSFSQENELSAMINTLNNYPEIDFSTYNSLGDFIEIRHENDYCNRTYDNHELGHDYNRFFEDIEYFLTIPLMGLAREHMTLSRCRVLVLDLGIEKDMTKEFDDSRNTQIYSIPETDKFNFSHGTRVAGVIAADNKDGGVNGITSSLIGDNLELISAAIDTTSGCLVTRVMDLLYKAIDNENPDICNMSLGWSGLDKNNNPVDNEDTNKLFKKIFEFYSNILFVVSGDNKYYEINNKNYAPAAIQLPNVITTGSTAYGYPQTAAAWSSYGPFVDIAAPGENCPTVDPNSANQVIFSSGNSFSAPAVAALAAVLKSINPSLTPGEIKRYIRDNSSPSAPSISGRRIAMSKAIQQLLLDIQAPQEIINKIDPSGNNGTWDVPGIVASRICRESTIKIAGQPTMACETSDTSNVGYLGTATGGAINFKQKAQLFIIGFCNKYKILNTEVPIIKYYPDITDAVTVEYINIYDSGSFLTGNGTAGTLVINNAFITERNPITNDPMVIEAEGIISGSMETVLNAVLDQGQAVFEGALSITISLWPGESQEFYQYFEDNCESY